jgi:hypothetical protein
VNRLLPALLPVVVALGGAALAGCPITGARDDIGRPCVVDGPPCAPDHVCLADDGADEGRCAPIVDYGGCDPATYPQQAGLVRAEGLDVDEPGELGFLRDVVRVEGDLFVDGPVVGSPLAVGTLCGLSGLQQVTGSLLIAQTDLVTLDGLQSLSFVGKGLGVAGNTRLEDLTGLLNLVKVVALDDTRDFEVVIADNRVLSREALQGFKDALQDRPSIRVHACGNAAALAANDDLTCGPEINRLLRRE